MLLTKSPVLLLFPIAITTVTITITNAEDATTEEDDDEPFLEYVPQNNDSEEMNKKLSLRITMKDLKGEGILKEVLIQRIC